MTILHKELLPFLPKTTYNCEDVENALEKLEDFQLVYDSERLLVQQIILPSTTKEMSSTSDSKKETDEQDADTEEEEEEEEEE